MGFDQPELLHDDELIVRVKHAALCQLNVKGPLTDLRGRSMPGLGVSVAGAEVTFPPGAMVVPPGQSEALSPWLAPPPVERPVPDHVDDQLTYAKMQDPEYRGQATLADGTQAAFYADPQPTAGEQDGPPTESMPPIQEPPIVPDGYAIGRVFHRGDACPDQDDLDLVINRSGDVMRVFTEETAGTLLRQDGSSVDWPEQLHMNGTLWEVVYPGDTDPVEQAQAAPESAADHG